MRQADGSVTVKGDPDHPANFGRLCSKGSALGQTVDLDGRLLSPMVRGKPASWEDAIGEVAARFRDALETYGPDSIAFYGSGQLLTEDYYVLNKLMKGFIGSANIDTNSRLCMASTVVGHKRAFGTDTVPGVYEDLELADLVILVGSNLAWCHPVLFQRIEAAKRARPTLKVVNIDPRRTATSDLADYDLRIASGGDVALFNGLLHQIERQGAVDRAYVAAHVTGFEAATEAGQPYDLARVAAETGLGRTELERFYADWIGTERVVTVFSQGVNQAVDGVDKVNAIINAHLATGRIGKPGAGPFSVTGQPNAMGGREVGGLATMLAEHLELGDAEHRDAVQQFWGSPTVADRPGLKAVDLFRACKSGQIKALWVLSTNPAVSMPEADSVADAIATCPFVVVSDIMANTDTAVLADVLLPAQGWGEKAGTVTNSDRTISRQRAFLPAPTKTRPDWRIICDVARAMGWEQEFAYSAPDQIFREHAAMSALARDRGLDFDITGLATLSPNDYDGLAPQRWPITDAGPSERLFSDGRFHHPDGKARMIALSTSDSRARPIFEHRLITGRVRDHWHTMTRTGKSPRLGRHMAEPYLEIHPSDAARIGVGPAELARLETATGAMIARVLVTDRVEAGTIFAPMHWTAETASQGRVGPLIEAAVDPYSGQPALKSSFITVRPFQAQWYGYALLREDATPQTDYWAKARIEGGWQIELADTRAPADWVSWSAALFGGDVETAIFEDPSAKVFRLAAIKDGKVTGLLFAAAQPVAVARAHLVRAFASSSVGFELLAGRAAADVPDGGALVCSCFGVGCNTITDAILSKGLSDVDAVGAAIGAGTNCGSCRPEIRALLAETRLKAVAE